MSTAPSSVPDRALSFGPFRLYRKRRQLLEDGRPVRLGGRALDLLIALVERAGEVLSREALEACVWPKAVVEETSLRAHVSALRRALGEGRSSARYITNIPGRGYCFVAPVATLPDAPAAPGAAGQRPLPNLPGRLTSIVGRAALVATMAERLRRRRLVTIAGPGGMGKTTLALAVAQQVLPVFAHGVWFVDLSLLTDPRLLAGTVAAVLDIDVAPGAPDGLLGAALGTRRLLLILDNCEHLIDAVAGLATSLLHMAPGLTLLATSREPLNVEGEWVHRLAALDTPPAWAPLSAAQVLAFPAAQLFVQRAQAISNRFELVDDDVPALVALCRRLDGVPLAIELAAARVDSLGLKELARRLEDPLQLLTHGRRSAPPRHQTLRALLAWSFELLTPAEKTVLGRLSVFKGGFTLDAAVAVAADDGLQAGAVIECVLGLALKSMLVADGSGALARYRLPAATRAYAGEQLLAAEPGRPVFRRHACHVLDLCKRAQADARRRARADGPAAQAGFIDEVSAALDGCLAAEGDAALGIELAQAVQPLLGELGLEPESAERSRRVLAQIHRHSSPPTSGLGPGAPAARARAAPAAHRAARCAPDDGSAPRIDAHASGAPPGDDESA